MEEDGKQLNKQTWPWLVDAIQEFLESFHVWNSPGMRNNTFEQRLFKSHKNALSCVSGDMRKILCSDGGQRRVACQAPHSVQPPSQGFFLKKMGRAGKGPGIGRSILLSDWLFQMR